MDYARSSGPFARPARLQLHSARTSSLKPRQASLFQSLAGTRATGFSVLPESFCGLLAN